MNTMMRRTVRGTATALGALAIVVGTAGCGSLLGGGDDSRTDDQEQGQEQDGEDTGEDTSTEDDSTTEDSADDAQDDSADDSADDTEGSSDDSAEETDDADTDDAADGSTDDSTDDAADDSDDATDDLSDEDLDAASQRFVDFMQVMDDGDGEAACAFFLDPQTDEPVTGKTLEMCGEMVTPQMEGLEPGTMDILDASMVTAIDNGDGTVTIDMMGTEFPNPMAKASDGEWYLSLG